MLVAGVGEDSIIALGVAAIAAATTIYGLVRTRRLEVLDKEKTAEFEKGLSAIHGFSDLTDQLQEELAHLRTLNAALQAEKAALQSEVSALSSQIVALERRIGHLEDRLTRYAGGLADDDPRR